MKHPVPSSFRFSLKGPFLLLLLSLLLLAASPAHAAVGDEKKKDDAKKAKPVQLARIVVSGALNDALPPESPFSKKVLYFKKLLDIIKKARDDDEVAGMLLKVDSPRISFAKIRELRVALADFKESGKKIYAFTEGAGLKDMTILSMCDFLALPESGAVVMPGFNLEVMYYKGLFEKIGFRMLVQHIGDFKSAFENFHLDGMSDANRKVLNCLLDEFYSSAVSMIAEGRKIPAETVTTAIDQALLTVKEAKAMGLVDAVMYRSAFDDYLKKDLGADKIKILKNYGRGSIDLDTTNPLALMKQILQAFSKHKKEKSDNPKIAVIYAAGPISSGKNSMDPFSQSPTIGSDTMVKAINEAADDDTVKAIVLRVDSPGGSGLASDLIWKAELEAKKKKPFIVSMGDVAGSGGYYISIAGDVILAEPGTITGSIGVVSAIPNISGTLGKLGIKVERLSRGRNAEFDSITAPPGEVNIGILTNYMEKFYWDFVDKVAAARKMTRDQVHALAQGRVWTGRQAVENGLIDAIGSLADALEVARVKAGLTEEDHFEIVESPEPPDFFEALTGGDTAIRSAFLGALGLSDGAGEMLLETAPGLRRALGDLYTFVRIAGREKVLCMMPEAFLTN